jgi:formylglycine-generating enzyme required for sulfatase activity
MAAIPAGIHRKLHGDARTSRVRIARFALDRAPVTRGEFLDFVRRRPQWRKSAAEATLVEKGYLADWSADLDVGTRAALSFPITNVSWYAASAYCEARGKRLPTEDEWELAAAASETSPNATRDPRFVNRLLGMYAGRADAVRKPVSTAIRNVYGIRGMHDLAWELTTDPHHDHAAMKGHRHTMSCASSAIGVADPSNYPAFMRHAVRAGLNRRSTMSTLGFRCAADLV